MFLKVFLAPKPIPTAIRRDIPPSMGQDGSNGSHPGSGPWAYTGIVDIDIINKINIKRMKFLLIFSDHFQFVYANVIPNYQLI